MTRIASFDSGLIAHKLMRFSQVGDVTISAQQARAREQALARLASTGTRGENDLNRFVLFGSYRTSRASTFRHLPRRPWADGDPKEVKVKQ